MAQINESGFEVLQVAVRIARDMQIKFVNALRDRLSLIFPKRPDDIEQAIDYWASYVQSQGERVLDLKNY